MARADVVVTWAFAPVPDAVKDSFERPTKFVVLPTPPNRGYGAQLRGMSSWPLPLKSILAKYAPGIQPYRVATLGFSESCQGVGGLLRSGDGGNLDAALAIDGIHTAPGKQVNPAALTAWVSFATLAALGQRLCVITHSSVQPPYASTTATAEHIWQQAAKTGDYVTIPNIPDIEAGPATIHVSQRPGVNPYDTSYPSVLGHMKPARRANGLVVLGWNNRDKYGYADHIWQAKVVLPMVVTKFLAARWNAIDPSDPEAVCYAG